MERRVHQFELDLLPGEIQHVGPFVSGEPLAVRCPHYRQKTLQVYSNFEPYQVIDPDLARDLDIRLCRIGRQKPYPAWVKIRPKDHLVLGSHQMPGVSSQIDFTQISSESSQDRRQQWIDLFAEVVLNTPPRVGSALHIAQIHTLHVNGFRSFLVPLHNHPLHVRICDTEIIQALEQEDHVTEIQYFESAEKLCRLWESFY